MTGRGDGTDEDRDPDLRARARHALLDALDALHDHRESVVVVGAQAIYLHTGAAPTPVAEATKDSDLAFDVRRLADQPLIDAAMRAAHFELDTTKNQPGAWISADGIPVDLMVPETLAGGSGSRAAMHPPHHKRALRRAAGLEAALVDYQPMQIRALRDGDHRVIVAKVAGPAALLVAKLHKIGERADTAPDRLVDKDAHDLYRILVAIDTTTLAERLRMLREDDLAGPGHPECTHLAQGPIRHWARRDRLADGRACRSAVRHGGHRCRGLRGARPRSARRSLAAILAVQDSQETRRPVARGTCITCVSATAPRDASVSDGAGLSPRRRARPDPLLDAPTAVGRRGRRSRRMRVACRFDGTTRLARTGSACPHGDGLVRPGG
ncbi:MAG TPA: hypothetical protein VH439_04305 [Gemmatimonadales bacterium]